MARLEYLHDDLYNYLGGKGKQACVRLNDTDGCYEVVGPPTCGSKSRMDGVTLDNVRYLLSRIRPERLAELARAAKRDGGVRF